MSHGHSVKTKGFYQSGKLGHPVTRYHRDSKGGNKMRPDGPRDPIAGPDSGPESPFPIRLSGPVIKGFGRGSKEVHTNIYICNTQLCVACFALFLTHDVLFPVLIGY